MVWLMLALAYLLVVADLESIINYLQRMDIFTWEKPSPSFDKYDNIDYDGKYILDKLTDVYYSATSHDEDQVPHLHVNDPSICIDKCKEEYGNPCQNFCPANVYEIVDDGEERLQINFNCVHCKTCDIMDPYQIIDWTTPQGGDGPSWKKCSVVSCMNLQII